MRVFHYSEVKAEEAEEPGASKLKVRWLIKRDMGAENFAMRLFEIEPGGQSPHHSHPWEHEVFILEGEGEVLGADGKRKLKPGDVVLVLPDEVHQFRNNGEKTFRFLCLIPNRPKP